MSGADKVGLIERTRRVEAGHVFTFDRLTLELGRNGRRVTYTLTLDTESTADGALVKVIRDAMTREGHSRVEARVAGPDLEIDIGTGPQRQTRRLPDAGLDLKTEEYSRAWRQAVSRGESVGSLKFRAFDAATGERLAPTG